MVSKMGSLETLDMTGNRLCGVWVDQYGQQGKWSADAVLALAEAIRESTSLATLLVGGNLIRDEGVKAIVGALRDDPEITCLGLENNEIGVEGAKQLATAVGAMVSLETIDLSNNAICGAASCGGRPPTPYSAHGMADLVEGARTSVSLKKVRGALRRWSTLTRYAHTPLLARAHEHAMRTPHTPRPTSYYPHLRAEEVAHPLAGLWGAS